MSVESQRSLLLGVDVAELQRSRSGCRRELLGRNVGDLEVAAQGLAQALALRGVESAEQAVRGKHGEPGVLECDEAHQQVAVLALAADLLGVGVRGLVAMVAVGDQQLGVLRVARCTAAIASGSRTGQRRCEVPSASVTSPQGVCAAAGSRALQARRSGSE